MRKCDEGGVLVDLKSWLCFSPTFASLNHKKTGNAVYLNIRKSKIVEVGQPRKALTSQDTEMKEPEPTVTVLSTASFEKAEVKYTSDHAIVILPSGTRIQLPDQDLPWKVQQAVDGILKIDSAEKKQEIQQWVDDSDVKESQ